jgi:hypothetical protein
MCAAERYLCDCALYCGTLRQVSRRTYFLHAPYRRTGIRTALDDFLAQAGDHNQGPAAVVQNIADHDSDEDMSEDLESDEDDAGDQPDQPRMQPEDDFDGIYMDDVVPLPLLLPHGEIAHPDPGDPHVEPLPQADPDGELIAVHDELDAYVCLSFLNYVLG